MKRGERNGSNEFNECLFGLEREKKRKIILEDYILAKQHLVTAVLKKMVNYG